MPPQWLGSVGSLGLMSVFMLGVAGLMNDLSHILSPNPISSEKRRELETKYGGWAVDTAIAVCPLDDIECIEREAKRLSEARFYRAYGR